MSTTATPTPDLAAIKARQQKAWASGDYSAVAATVPIISEELCDAADLRAGARVLDIAGGSGNTALAAARCGCEVVSIDYVPSLLHRARERAQAEGLEIETIEGDAEALPFPDASFDAVVSALGVMFAPDHERTAAELLRVCRPGGTVALANWTPDGFIGELFATIGSHLPPPPPGLTPPPLWGTEEHLRALLGDGMRTMRTRVRSYTFRYRSAEHFVEYFRQNYGPVTTAFAGLDPAGQRALAQDIATLARRFNRLSEGGPVACAADYLEIVGTRA